MLMRAVKILIPTLLVVSCTSSELSRKGKASRVTEVTQEELEEDARRPFLSLASSRVAPESIELWKPSDKSSIWTPKGDANFYSGYGATVSFTDKTIRFFTKELAAGREYSEVKALNADEWASFEQIYQQMALVEFDGPTRPCSASLTEGFTHMEQRGKNGELELVLNYRTAPCHTTYTDTLSFHRLFKWLEANGAPWI